MKVAFVNNGTESLGVGYLAAFLKKQGHTVKVFNDPQLFSDEYINNKHLNRIFSFQKQLINDVINFSPDLIGFSVLTDYYEWACYLAAELKKRLARPIIFGGIHPTSVPEEVLKNNFVDMVCIGEGELALLDVVEKLEKSSWPYNVLNIWTKDGQKIIKNKIRPLIDDLGKLPYPDKTVFYEVSPYFKTAYFTIASRGCLYKCSYCCHSYLREIYPETCYYRIRSVENLIGELECYRVKDKYKVIRFVDDIFPSDKKWLSEFSKVYSKRIGVPFICYIHPSVAREEQILLLKKSGACEIVIGVQTLFENTQKEVLNRQINIDNWERTILCLKEHKIFVTAENMIGIPGQCIDEIKELVKFYCRNKVGRIHVNWLRYYPKTKITDKFGQGMQGIRKRDIKPFTLGGDVFNEELNKMRVIFALINFLPNKLICFILRSNVYKYLPSFPLVFINIFSNLKSGAASNKITRKREFLRYYTYIKKKKIIDSVLF
ncbi:MAG: B12-binding domain-containing radical SAM protein [Candidatus Omnitrophica bacterium]|nr:B12-binding domain-containing radical SAM protein [Candidatus Omnitrophota bacterium]